MLLWSLAGGRGSSPLINCRPIDPRRGECSAAVLSICIGLWVCILRRGFGIFCICIGNSICILIFIGILHFRFKICFGHNLYVSTSTGVHQSTKRARSGRKRERALRPGLRIRLGRDGQSATLRNFKRSHHGSRGRSITQLAVPLNPRLLLSCQAFPLLFVRAEGDEGDTVLLGHPTILTGLVIERTGSPGDAPPNVLFPAFYELPLRPSS